MIRKSSFFDFRADEDVRLFCYLAVFVSKTILVDIC